MHEPTKHVIEVTADDIALGERDDSLACPIALAMDRATGQRWNVAMLSAWVFERIGPDVALPAEAVAFITMFDDGKPVQPITFELEW